MNRLLITLGAAALVAGCSEGSGWNDPFHKATKEEVVAASAARSYKEIRRGETIYVVSTPEAAKRVQEGKEPALKVAAFGFGPAGEKVVFEASKETGLENALMEEFSRRHGVSQGAGEPTS